jgi:MFS superfamily sulfate permease-like transporter
VPSRGLLPTLRPNGLRGWLRPDLIAGVTVYVVPRTVAYAQLASLLAVTGLKENSA